MACMLARMAGTLAGVVSVAAMSFATPAMAQEGLPTKPIHFIVGFAAGGGNDLFARIVLQKFQENTGITAVVENKAGAGGRIAAEYVARAAADGTTILVGASGQMSIAAAIYPNLGYHPTKSFVPLNMIASFPLVMVVPATNPSNTVKEMVAWAKANPDKANYGTSSPAFTIASELLKLKAGFEAVAIPYKSTNESNLAVVGSQALFAISDGPPSIPLVNGGKLKALAVTGAERSAELPNVPSMTEAGYPDVNSRLWSGFFAPTGTPKATVDALTAALAKALADKAVIDGLRRMGTDPGGPTGAAFGKVIDDDITAVTEVVKAAKLTFQQ